MELFKYNTEEIDKIILSFSDECSRDVYNETLEYFS
jgi:hypothetical protein